MDISNFFPVMNRSECSEEDFKLWFHSYFALIVIHTERMQMPAITCSKLAIEALEQGVKYVQNVQS